MRNLSGRGFTTSKNRAWIVLEDGTTHEGKAFGYPKNTIGEVVFTTGMVGYPQSLTDPSYRGQILMFTYPLIGNYGVPDKVLDENGIPIYFESNQVQVQGIIVYEQCEKPSHWASIKSLHEWLYEENVPGVYDVDTRSLTQKIRVKGVMMGAIVVGEEPEKGFELLSKSRKYGEINFVEQVSVKETKIYSKGDKKIVLIDYGVKYNIIRNLIRRGFKVICVPYNCKADEILSYRPDGIVLSNGPGDPKILYDSIRELKKLLESFEKPILGICLGNQLLALASEGDTYKLKFGHRGQNKPVKDVNSGKCYIVSENHGYAINPESIRKTEFDVWFKNIDDGTIEGIRHKSRPILSVQFHPEAYPGPYDTTFIFEHFARMVNC
ncbi:MAG: glutamine-hydrolyzing carbamoyl-phosphate synthase small subunit [Nitrososphaeria archaeon]